MKIKSLIFSIASSFILASCAESGIEQYENKINTNVKYVVEGTAQRVFITYEAANGVEVQKSNVVLPWELKFSANPNDFLYLSARNQGDDGSVTVIIYDKEEEFGKDTTDVGYGTATASGLY